MYLWPIVIIVIIVAMVWYARGGAPAGLLRTAPRQPPGLDLLAERYARGEIDRDEYLEKKGDLGRAPAPDPSG